MLRHFAETLAWLSIFIVFVGIVAIGFAVKYFADNNYPEGDTT
jgi:cbb3-type cytochrome oxidase subunit 3